MKQDSTNLSGFLRVYPDSVFQGPRNVLGHAVHYYEVDFIPGISYSSIYITINYIM